MLSKNILKSKIVWISLSLLFVSLLVGHFLLVSINSVILLIGNLMSVVIVLFVNLILLLRQLYVGGASLLESEF